MSDRNEWPVRVMSLGSGETKDLSTTTSVQERLGMVLELTDDVWSLTRREIPDYQRHEIPVVVISRSHA
ncbi:MAG: hypothetical protein ACE5FJ_07635 [Gemmatimonadales bacterium]